MQEIRHHQNSRKLVLKPKAVCEHECITALWNEGVQIDTEFMANRPYLIIKNNTDKICLLVDVATSLDGNVIQKESEN
jgi:hypothetical protein